MVSRKGYYFTVGLLSLLCLYMVVFATGYKTSRPNEFLSGKGGVSDYTNGRVYLTLDSTTTGHKDSCGVSFRTALVDVSSDALALTGFFQLVNSSDAWLGANNGGDSCVATLKTGYDVSKSFTIRVDTLDTAGIVWFSYDDIDSLCKPYLWYEVNIWDSANAAAVVRVSPTRYYQIQAGFNTK